MSIVFALDLKRARRASGLTQSDCAHLLGIHRSKLSRIERGKLSPSAIDVVLMSLIYNSTYEELCRSAVTNAVRDLRERLNAFENLPHGRPQADDRIAALDRLDSRLEALMHMPYGAA